MKLWTKKESRHNSMIYPILFPNKIRNTIITIIIEYTVRYEWFMFVMLPFVMMNFHNHMKLIWNFSSSWPIFLLLRNLIIQNEFFFHSQYEHGKENLFVATIILSMANNNDVIFFFHFSILKDLFTQITKTTDLYFLFSILNHSWLFLFFFLYSFNIFFYFFT